MAASRISETSSSSADIVRSGLPGALRTTLRNHVLKPIPRACRSQADLQLAERVKRCYHIFIHSGPVNDSSTAVFWTALSPTGLEFRGCTKSRPAKHYNKQSWTISTPQQRGTRKFKLVLHACIEHLSGSTRARFGNIASASHRVARTQRGARRAARFGDARGLIGCRVTPVLNRFMHFWS
jgi:hypothetical protein